MKEQGALVQSFLVVEVIAVRQMEALQRALGPDHVLYKVRCVRAALAAAGAGVRCLS